MPRSLAASGIALHEETKPTAIPVVGAEEMDARPTSAEAAGQAMVAALIAAPADGSVASLVSLIAGSLLALVG